jgi:hypothetical protein
MRFMPALLVQRPSRSRERWPSRERTSTVPEAGAGSCAALLQQALQRQVQQVRVVAAVDHHLADVAEHLLHRLDVQAIARHRGRLLVFGKHRAEALRIALGLRDDPALVALGLLAQPGCRALCLGDHVARVGLAFLLQPVAVLARLERVLERRLHLLGRLDALHVDVDDDDAGLQSVELELDRFDEIRGDGVACLVQHRINPAAADNLPHRRFRRERHGLFRVAVLEQEVARILQPVLHREADVDDVLVLRQHRRVSQPGGLHDLARADLACAQLRDVDRLVRLERVRRAPLEPGVDGMAVLAEGGDHRLLALLHDEEAAAEPD